MNNQSLQERNKAEQQQDLKDIPTSELVQILGKVMGAENMAGITEDAPLDEEYKIFSEGPHSEQTFRRVANPCYGLQKRVMIVGMKCRAVHETAKHTAADHFGWDLEDEQAEHYPTEELGKFQMHEQILPMIVRGDLPEQWEPEHMSSKEVERMWKDFFLST